MREVLNATSVECEFADAEADERVCRDGRERGRGAAPSWGRLE